MIPDIPYLRELPEYEWVREVISEKFQNATELMTRNSVIYGGAVRDALAGLKLVGDLDIAVPPEELSELRDNFLGDTRWQPRDQKLSPFERVRAAGYPAPVRENIPMTDILEFVTYHEAIVQIMVSNQAGKDMFTKAIGMARQVDILCCGMILTSDGRVFETLEGAFEDCQSRVLRINPSSTTIHLETVPSRIEKLVDRGWTNQIDVDKVKEDVKAKRKKAEREKLRKHASMQNKYKKKFFKPVTEDMRLAAKKAALQESMTVNHNKTEGAVLSYKLRIPAALTVSITDEDLTDLINERMQDCEFSMDIVGRSGDLLVFADRLTDLFGLRSCVSDYLASAYNRGEIAENHFKSVSWTSKGKEREYVKTES